VPSLLLAEHAENEIRKDFTPSERVAIGRAIEAEIGDRRRFNADGGPRVDEAIPENFPESVGKETRQIAAELAGFGNPETYRQAKTVVDNAEPELIEAMDRGEVAISEAARCLPVPWHSPGVPINPAPPLHRCRGTRDGCQSNNRHARAILRHASAPIRSRDRRIVRTARPCQEVVPINRPRPAACNASDDEAWRGIEAGRHPLLRNGDVTG